MKPRILLILPEPPVEPWSGPRTLYDGLVRNLPAISECTVVSLCRNAEEARAFTDAPRDPSSPVTIAPPIVIGSSQFSLRNTAMNVLNLMPLRLVTAEAPRIAERISTDVDCRLFDLVVYGSLFVAPLRAHLNTRGKVAVIPYDAFSMNARRCLSQALSATDLLRESWRLLSFVRIEGSLGSKFDAVLPVSEVDERYLRERLPGVAIRSIGIGLPRDLPARETRVARVKKYQVVCHGNFTISGVYRAAREFVRLSWPIVKSAVPEATLLIFGSGAHGVVRGAGVPESHAVEASEWEEDYFGSLESADALVYPQKVGAGIQTKLQQAMALGIPVVAHPRSLQPLGALSGTHAVEAVTPDETARAVIELLTDTGLNQRIGEAGAALIHERFSDQAITRNLTEVLCALGIADREGSSRT